MEFNRLLQIRRIYAQRAALELPRGKEIIERWPDADVVLVDNHWNIPEVHGDETNVPRWSRIKTEALVLGGQESVDGQAERPVRGLHCTLNRERLRNGLRLLLRAPA
jgi:hypothetical protein